jgi:hypothetical protein
MIYVQTFYNSTTLITSTKTKLSVCLDSHSSFAKHVEALKCNSYKNHGGSP